MDDRPSVEWGVNGKETTVSVDWQVGKSTRQCAVTGRSLEIGEEYYSALREEGELFLRSDFSLEGWEQADKAPFFSYWRSTVQPETDDKKRRLVIDVEAFYTFFRNLEGAEEPRKQLFRYLLSLILIRKRFLALRGIEKSDDGDCLVLWDRREEKEHRVPSGNATPEALQEAQDSLNQIFECQIGAEDL